MTGWETSWFPVNEVGWTKDERLENMMVGTEVGSKQSDTVRELQEQSGASRLRIKRA